MSTIQAPCETSGSPKELFGTNEIGLTYFAEAFLLKSKHQSSTAILVPVPKLSLCASLILEKLKKLICFSSFSVFIISFLGIVLFP